MVLVASVLLLRVTITRLSPFNVTLGRDVRQTDIPVGFVILYMIFIHIVWKYLIQLDRT